MIENPLQLLTEELNDFLLAHQLIAWVIAIVVLLILTIKILSEFIPQFEVVLAKIIVPAARKIKFKSLQKAAIKSDIRGNVNSVIKKYQGELPIGWVKEIDINWVQKVNKEDFLEENLPVIRMRPVENQGINFVNAVYYILKKSFFPKTRYLIPEIPRDASTLYMSQRLIKTQKKDLETIFQENILEPAIQKRDKILDYFERYKKIDEKGFFTGTFLREVHEIADRIRLSALRRQMNQEIVEVLKHIEEFSDHINVQGDNLQPEHWSRVGPATTYSFLLVANKNKTSGGIQPYINRATEKLAQGVTRMYIFGTEGEKWFAKSVVNGIKNINGWEFLEEFELHKDYRGMPGGIGALFIKKENLPPKRA